MLKEKIQMLVEELYEIQSQYDYSKMMTLQDDYRRGADIWYNEWDLANALCYQHDVPKRVRFELLYKLMKAIDKQGEYEVGDIVYLPEFNGVCEKAEREHRIFVITSKEDDGSYKGYELRGNNPDRPKSNKDASAYHYNIFIKNYSDIIEYGEMVVLEAYVSVNRLMHFTNDDLFPQGKNKRGTWKGRVKPKFLRLVDKAAENFRNYEEISNRRLEWGSVFRRYLSTKIIDISQDVLSCITYPGDPVPESDTVKSFEKGDNHRFSLFSMSAHNGTHVDAPSHFVKDGKTIDEIPLEVFVGECYVAHHEGDVTAEDAEKILEKAEVLGADERILIAGDATVTAEAARVFASSGAVKLLGNESQCVGPKESPMEVHVILLEAGIILLEGVVLKDVYEGKYLLNAAPINLGGLEGAPCRAYLIGT